MSRRTSDSHANVRGMRLIRRREPAEPQPTIRVGITRAGRVGIGIFVAGALRGWGLNETAAWANYEQRIHAA